MSDKPGAESSAPEATTPAEATNEAFGFEPAAVSEKYNTEYIVKNMNKERRTGRLVIIGVLVAAIAGALLWVSLVPDPAPPSAEADTSATE